MKTDTTRRALLGGAGLATAALIAPAVAATRATSSAIVSPELSRLIKAADDAKHNCADVYRHVYDPAWAEAERQIAALPHAVVEVNGTPWTTADAGALRVAERVVKTSSNSPDLPELRKLVAADIKRRRAADRVRRTTGLRDAYDRITVLEGAETETQDAVGHFPCESIVDLQAKLKFMVEREMGDGMDRLDEVLADVTRIAKREGR